MPRYADKTRVPVERSRAELERTLHRYGCSKFGYLQEEDRVTIAFEASEPARKVRFVLPLPARAECRSEAAHGQICRQRWRALVLAVKAKLEAVESGIATFEEEFLAYTVVPGGQTVGDWLLPTMPAVLDGASLPMLEDLR